MKMNFITKMFARIGAMSMLALVGNSVSAQVPFTISQSSDKITTQQQAIGCWGGGGLYHNNQSYWRLYDLSTFAAITAPKFKVQQVDYGLLLAQSLFGGSFKIVVNTYLCTGAFIKANLTLRSTDTITLSGTLSAGANAIRQFANSGAIYNATDKVAVEIFSFDGAFNYDRFMPANNGNGQTGISYLSSAACSIPEPTDISSLLATPLMHLMIDLKGVTGEIPLQPDNFTSSRDNVCIGSSNIVYTVPPVAYAGTYIWTYSGTGATIVNNGNSATVSYANNATSGTLSVHVTNEFGTSPTRSIQITVGPSLTIDLLPLNPSICEGDSIELTADFDNAYSYEWQPPTGLTAINTKTVKASPAQSHTYTVTVTDSSFCKGTGTVFLEVRNRPVITLNPSKLVVCEDGDSLTITALGADVYTWLPNAFMDNNTSNVVKVKPISSMTYTLNTVGANGCDKSIDVPITVTNILNPPITQNGKVLTAPTGYQSYLWYLDGIPVVPTAFFNQYTAKKDGLYKVYVTDGDGCGGFSDEMLLKGLKIDEIFKNDIKVYPNPTNGLITVQTERNITLELQSIDGRKVINTTKTKTIDLSKLPDGVYMLVVKDIATNATSFEKVIKSSN